MVNIVNNTIALMHFDNEKNSFKDELGNLTWTINSGTATITTDNAKFDKCCNLSGVYATTNEFDFGKDLTIDFWDYLYAYGYYEMIISLCQNSKMISDRILRHESRNIMYTSNSYNNGYYILLSPSNGILCHWAIVWDSTTNTVRFYINGSLKVELQRFIYCENGPVFLAFGAHYNPGSLDVKRIYQYISELRVSNCVRYTDNFTPPDRPYNIFHHHKLYDNTDKCLYSLI